MASHAAVASFGTTLKLKGTGSTYTRIADIVDVEIPGFDFDVHDVTHMESPNGMKEKLAGLGDAGSITATIRFVPGSTEAAAIYAMAGLTKGFKIEAPAPQKGCTFDAIVKTWKPSKSTVSGLQEGTLTLDVTGALTWEAGA